MLQRILPLNEIDAVVLSHYHADHIADLGCLRYASRIDMDLGRRKRPLKIYGHREDPAFATLSYLDFAVGEAYGPDSELAIGPFSLNFAPTMHPDPCYAMRVSCGGSSLVYTGDTGALPSLAPFARGTDLLVCETSLYDEYRGRIPGHMCAGEAGALALEAEAGMLLATHLPHFGEHSDLLRQASAAFGGKTALASLYWKMEL